MAVHDLLPVSKRDAEDFPAELTTAQKVEILRQAFADALVPPDDLMLDEWADRHRVLTSISSSEEGPWRTERFPFLREIMRELSPCSSRQQVVVMKGAQLGFTEVAVNWILYTMDQDPAPIMYVQKTIDAVERFSKQRLQPSMDVCSRVANKISDDMDRSNTIRMKTFPGGVIILGGANSAASLRSMPIERLILDEEESYDADIDAEGSPSDLAIRRTANFPRRKIFRLSTPAIKEMSKIEPLFEKGTKSYFYVPCPFCTGFQKIRWSNIKYDFTANGDPKNVRLQCELCGEDIPERYKNFMLERGEWRAEFPDREVASYHINSLYSPIGFFSWKDAVNLWVEANNERDKSKLKVFINTVLAETWTETHKTIETAGLISRKEEYHLVPANARVLTAGVDVQEHMICIEVVAWGKGQESWSIDYTTFMGDTESSFVWDQLSQYLQRGWEHEDGQQLNIALTGIDSGHRARVVYKFCRQYEPLRVYPVKGRYGWGMGLLKRPKTRNQDGVYLFIAYVDELKSKVYSQLMIDKPGAGYCHFPDSSCYNGDYFRGLTAERLVTKRTRGQHSLQWECPPGRRNEPLDCRSYAIAALNILNPNFDLLDTVGPLQVRNRPMAGARRGGRVLSRGL